MALVPPLLSDSSLCEGSRAELPLLGPGNPLLIPPLAPLRICPPADQQLAAPAFGHGGLGTLTVVEDGRQKKSKSSAPLRDLRTTFPSHMQQHMLNIGVTCDKQLGSGWELQ
jgi:hypothetical protein